MKKNALLSLPILFLILTSCGTKEEFHDLKKYIIQLKQKIAVNVKTSGQDVINPPKPSSYQKAISRTPFEETKLSIAQSGILIHPLYRYPISLLRFLGTVKQNNRIFAYIAVPPDNKIYRVTMGDKIGDHGGTIQKIGLKELQISEPVSNDENGKSQKPKIITIQLKDENS